MKTTVEIPDDLLRRAKSAAATRGISLKRFLTEAVERRLAPEHSGARPGWKALAGGLASLRKETARIQRKIDREFERIDEEDRR
jgi:hypothetical protein